MPPLRLPWGRRGFASFVILMPILVTVSNRCYVAAAAAAAHVVLPLPMMMVLAHAAVVIQTAKVALVGVGLAFGSLQVSAGGPCDSLTSCRIALLCWGSTAYGN